MSNTIGPNNDFTGAEKIKGKKFKKAKKQEAMQIEDGNEKAKKKSHKKALILGGMTALALLGVGVQVAKGKAVAAPDEKVLTRAQEHIQDFTQVALGATERAEGFAEQAKSSVEAIQAKINTITETFLAGGKEGQVLIETAEDKSRIMKEFADDGVTVIRTSVFAPEKDLPTSIIEVVGDSKNTYDFKKAGILSHYSEGERMMGDQHYKTKELRLNPDGKTIQIYKEGIKEAPGGVTTDKVVEFGERDRILQYVEGRTDMVKDGTIVSQNELEVKFTPKGKLAQVTSDHAINIEAGRQPGFGFKEQMDFNDQGVPVMYKGPNEAGEMEKYTHRHEGAWHLRK